MKKIACWTMIGAKSKIKERPNSYEVFGIDYMIDVNYNTWLIEINKNPALEYSTVNFSSSRSDYSSLQQNDCHDSSREILLIWWIAIF